MSKSTVWKYPLTLRDRQTIAVPVDPRPLRLDPRRIADELEGER